MKNPVNPLILLILVQTMAQTAFAQAIWNGTADTAWYNDSLNEFTITTPEQLAGLAKLVNNENSFEGKKFKLGANIMLNDTANWQNWADYPPINHWKPINLLNGTFNGNGHIISGVYINSTEDHQGLFGIISDEGVVKNLGITASYIRGKDAVGGLVGHSEGIIGGSYSTAWVVGESFVGGLAGVNENFINNSYSVGKVAGEEMVGGLVGANRDRIRHSYSAAFVDGDFDYVGGLAGVNSGEMSTKPRNRWNSGCIIIITGSDVINSYYDKEASKQSDSKADGKTTAEMKQKATYEGWNFGKVWGISGEVNGGYPYLLNYNKSLP
jgi:hypothetical protein